MAEQLDGWVKIEFDEGGEGDGADEVSAAYVSTDYVDVRYALAEAIKFSPAEESASLRSQVVNYAMQFLGNPYVWGGTSLTRGADCSGFTMSVMKHFGIPRPLFRRPGQAGHQDQIQPDAAWRLDLLWQQPGKDQPRGYVYRKRPDHPCGQQKEWIKISSWNYRTPLSILVDIIGD